MTRIKNKAFFENGIFLAPMAGVTDMPFRILCKEQGCDFVYTEMISAKSILYENVKTELLLQTDRVERPVGVQLFGNDPVILSEMAKKIDNDSIALFDINMGCPVPKVVNNGEGSALMKNPRLVGEIVKALSNAVNKPITIKIRKGFDPENINAVEIAQIAQENGASAVAVHGRTREQYYSGKADWKIIKQVKENVSIPVIGSGDIFSALDAHRMFQETGCDSIMVARGAQGNPWIFREIKQYLKTGKVPERPSLKGIEDMILRHTELLIELKGEYIAIREMRKHIGWYTKGIKNASKIRSHMNHIESYSALLREIKGISELV